MRSLSFLAVVTICMLLSGCMYESPAERALRQMRSVRQSIRDIHAYRESAKPFVPIQQRIAATLSSFDEVASCECVIFPETSQIVTANSDGSMTYGEETHWQINVLITLKTLHVWDDDRPERELAALLRDNGLKSFCLFKPVHSGMTWIVTGTAPVQPPPEM